MPTVIAVFDTSSSLDSALDTLYKSGFKEQDVTVLNHLDTPDEGAGTPVIAPIAGTQGSVSTGTGGGAAPLLGVGAFRDRLPGVKLSDEEAAFYLENLDEESRLVAVTVESAQADQVTTLLREGGASRVNTH